MGSTLETYPTVNYRGHDAIYVNPYKYLCCWVTKREPSTRMVTSSNEYINLGFIEQTISEKGMMELLYVISNQTWNCLPGNTYYPCALLKR